MEKLKLFALFLLLFSGSTQAALYGFDVSWTTLVTGCPLCSAPGTGAGTWDTATNVIDFTGVENMHIDFNDGVVTDATVTRHITIDTDALTYTYFTTACYGSDIICHPPCSGCSWGVAHPLGNRIFLLDPSQEQTSGFVWDGVRPIRTVQTGVQNRKFTFTNLTPVPVPTAALLFGSAMIGLTGIRRSYWKSA